MTNVAMRGTQRLAVIAAPSLLLAGCALRGAPTFEIFGAYFPLWLLGGVIGLVAALLAHRLFVASGWALIVPLQLSVCLAIGLTIAALVWLSGTGLLL